MTMSNYLRAVAASLPLFGSAASAAQATVVMIEQAYSDTSVNVHCDTAGGRTNQCSAEGKLEIAAFIRRVTTQAQINPKCAGLRFVVPGNLAEQAKMALTDQQLRQPWALRIDFTPGASKLPWMLFSPGPDYHISEGVDEPKNLAASICAIVKGVGADVKSSR